MQTIGRPLPITNSTLKTLLAELGEECQKVQALIYQLQLPHLSDIQKAEIMAELLAAAIHLEAHCGVDFQDTIAEEMEKLPDEDEED